MDNIYTRMTEDRLLDDFQMALRRICTVFAVPPERLIRPRNVSSAEVMIDPPAPPRFCAVCKAILTDETAIWDSATGKHYCCYEGTANA